MNKNNCEILSNFEIAQTFKKYMNLKYHPLGVNFSEIKPKNILSLFIRRWFAEDLAKDVPESFLAYPEPYTFKGELKRLLKKYPFP